MKLIKGINRLGRSAWTFIKKLWDHPQGRVGLIMALFLAFCAIFAPLIAPYDPYDVTQRAAKGLAPCLAHPLGTTITTGQDILSMLIYGARVSLSVGLVTGLCIAFLGAFFGILTGYMGGLVDMAVMRVVDVMLVIPTLPLTIVLTNLFGKSYFMIIFIFTIFGWTGLARAAVLAGAGRGHIMFRHILPGVTHLLIMNTAITSAGIMVAEAGLSFLGLGDPTAISWGKMLADAQSGGALLFGHWWWILAPGIGIFLSVFAFMRIGLAMEKQTSGLHKLFKSLNNTYIEEVFASMEENPQEDIVPEPQEVTP